MRVAGKIISAKPKAASRQELKTLTEEFREKGGQIQRIPTGTEGLSGDWLIDESGLGADFPEWDVVSGYSHEDAALHPTVEMDTQYHGTKGDDAESGDE
jgi:hypothetical protein